MNKTLWMIEIFLPPAKKFRFLWLRHIGTTGTATEKFVAMLIKPEQESLSVFGRQLKNGRLDLFNAHTSNFSRGLEIKQARPRI